MRALLLLAAIGACGALPQCSAADWHALDGGKNLAVEIDKDSIVLLPGGLKKAWILFSYAEPQTSSGYPSFTYQSQLQLSVFDCAERTTDVLQMLFYSENAKQGTLVNSKTYTMKQISLRDVAPGTVGEEWLMYACQFGRKPSRSKK